jgi:hypothetical protein
MTCTGSTFTPARTCNGAGVCQVATPVSCAPYVCDPDAGCLTGCTTNDCSTGFTCVGGVCQ